jgi:hypothetical protein
MAKKFYTCESCGIGVNAREVEEGGAFLDGEHCYCAICVARLMQKVRTAQRGGKARTVGIVFQKGFGGEGPRVPTWLLYTIVAQAALAAILLVVALIPTTVKLPQSDQIVKDEVEIKGLLAQAEAALAAGGKAQEALSILKRTQNLALGTPWTYLVEDRLKQADKLFREEATSHFINVEKLYKTHMVKSEFGMALSSLEKFPKEHRGSSYWKVDIAKLRKDAQFCQEANQAYRELIARAEMLRRTQKYDEAIEALRSFPSKYAGTPAEAAVLKQTEDIAAQRQRWIDMKKGEKEEQDAMAARLEEKRRKQQEQTRKAMEEIKRRAEEARQRAKEEEARRREEEEKKEKPEPGPEPKPEQVTAVKVLGPWEEVKLTPAHENKFPFLTPRPDLKPLEQGAKKEVLILPYPHKGKVSGFSVKDYQKYITVDTDADGKHDKQLPADGGVVVLKISHVKDSELKCAVEIKREGERLQYQRYGWMEGRFKGVRIGIIDENSNTKYNESGKDAIITGKGKGAAVLENLIEIKGKFYEISVEEDGSKLRLRPVELATGKLHMTRGFKAGGKLDYVVVLGQVKGSKHLVSFELSGQRRSVSVPAGQYFIYAGSVSTRDGSRVCIWGGPKAKDFNVEEGKTAAPKWGAPGVIEFEYTLHTSGHLEIEDNKIHLYGQLGERYIDWGPKQWLPRVQVKDQAGKVIMNMPFPHTSDFEDYYLFKELLPVNKKLKVRITGDPKFLGRCESKWK